MCQSVSAWVSVSSSTISPLSLSGLTAGDVWKCCVNTAERRRFRRPLKAPPCRRGGLWPPSVYTATTESSFSFNSSLQLTPSCQQRWRPPGTNTLLPDLSRFSRYLDWSISSSENLEVVTPRVKLRPLNCFKRLAKLRLGPAHQPRARHHQDMGAWRWRTRPAGLQRDQELKQKLLSSRLIAGTAPASSRFSIRDGTKGS